MSAHEGDGTRDQSAGAVEMETIKETPVCLEDVSISSEGSEPTITSISNTVLSSSILERTLDLKDAIAIVVGIMVGSGIFASPGVVLRDVEGNVVLFFLVWIGGGLLALFGGLCFAELARYSLPKYYPYEECLYRAISIKFVSMIPSSGASYQYLLEAFGRLPAFLFAWTFFWAIKSGSIAIISLIFARYITQVVFTITVADLDHDYRVKIVGVLAIIILTIVNCVNVKGGAWLQNILAVLKFGGMTLAVLFALKILFWNNGLENLKNNFANPLEIPKENDAGWAMTVLLLIPKIGLATIASMWAYDGWMDVTSVSEEVQEPEKNVPKSILLGVSSVVISYILVNLSYLIALPKEQVETSQTIAVDLGKAAVGDIGGTIMGLVVSTAALGALNGSILTGGRVFYAAARDGLFPLSKYVMMTGYFKTPYVALLVQGGWSIAVLLPGNFSKLVDYFGLASYIFYGLTVIGLMWLRYKQPDRNRPFSASPYPIVPILFIFAATLIVLSGMWLSFIPFVGAVLFILGGVPIYYLFFHWGNLVLYAWDVVRQRYFSSAEKAQPAVVVEIVPEVVIEEEVKDEELELRRQQVAESLGLKLE